MGKPPILDNKHTASPSVFVPSALLREARRQKDLALADVPPVCILEPVLEHIESSESFVI